MRPLLLIVAAAISSCSGFAGRYPGELLIFGDCPDGTVVHDRHDAVWSIEDRGGKVALLTGDSICADLVGEPRGGIVQFEQKSCGALHFDGGEMASIFNGSQARTLAIVASMSRQVVVIEQPAM